jgi:hypothetical protein
MFMNTEPSVNKQEQQTSMTEITSLVDRKIEDAKLVILEKRFNYLLTIGGALLVIFGILLPLFLVFQNNERVDDAIGRMDNNFKELAGKQMRKPSFACFVDGKHLENSTLTFTQNEYQKVIEVKNIGDGTADYFDYNVYVKKPKVILLNTPFLIGDLDTTEFNDETSFDSKMTARIQMGTKIPAGDTVYIKLRPDFSQNKKGDEQVQTLLKIFYGEPEPKRIPFDMRLISQGSD